VTRLADCAEDVIEDVAEDVGAELVLDEDGD
jgi:hypothetical protein